MASWSFRYCYRGARITCQMKKIQIKTLKNVNVYQSYGWALQISTRFIVVWIAGEGLLGLGGAFNFLIITRQPHIKERFFSCFIFFECSWGVDLHFTPATSASRSVCRCISWCARYMRWWDRGKVPLITPFWKYIYLSCAHQENILYPRPAI